MTTDTNNNNKISLREYDKELPLISVIMPAYNSEASIEKAVLSCTGQSYPNVEIIIVDNGSSDETLKVANKLCESCFFKMPDGSKAPRIRIIAQDNKGVSAARNIAIKNAGGEYFVSLDSDDYYDFDTIESLYKTLTENDADVSICGIRKVWEQEPEKNTEYIPVAFSGNIKAFSDGSFVRLYDLNLIGTHSNKLYKSSLIRDNAIYYNEELAVNEDIDFVLRYLAVCRRMSVVPRAFLSYVQHERGQSLINTFQPHGLKGALIVLQSAESFMDTAGTEDKVRQEMYRRMFVHICSFAGLMYYRSDYGRAKIREELHMMCADSGFKHLLKEYKCSEPKDALAHFLLKHGLVRIYDGLCRIIYKNKH